MIKSLRLPFGVPFALPFWASHQSSLYVLADLSNSRRDRSIRSLRNLVPSISHSDVPEQPVPHTLPKFPADVPVLEPHDVPVPEPIDPPVPDPGEEPNHSH